MPERKWIDKTQPQTLQAAVLFCYLNAALAVLYLLIFHVGPWLPLILLGGTAYGMANEWRWAYWASVVLAGLYLLVQLIFFFTGGGFSGILNLLFAAVLFGLLVHPESRQYERIWFH
ncbi:MAG TPA: hypothetical protein VHB02_07560 [Acidimicrobiales bacterium]|nr:hypothetical protein [Acidimicrobiales bacterium]